MITKNIIQSKIKIIPTGRISPNQKGHSKGLQLYVKIVGGGKGGGTDEKYPLEKGYLDVCEC